MNSNFEMVAKTLQGLEAVLADELRALGADDVTPGNRMVSFRGDLAMLYRANMCCRTALRILKPFYSFEAKDSDELYSKLKEFDWSTLMTAQNTFSIDTVAYSSEFRNSQFVTYRVKDAIVDWFRDREGDESRPRVRLDGADVMFNVHISGTQVTVSLDSSGESLHKRGWRTGQTEAPISEVLAAGIILMSGWKGDTPFVDPMCGSGTFAIEAAMIAAGIMPGIYRRGFAFEHWPDFDRELFEEIYNDDSNEREVTVPIIAADISPKAIAIATDNAKHAGVERYITFETRPLSQWTEAPQPAGVLVTNPPYGKRITSDDMNALFNTIGRVLKHVFLGYNAWIIGYEDIYFHEIGLAPSCKVQVKNGGLDCEVRQYVIFEGKKADFRAAGGAIKEDGAAPVRRRQGTDSRRPAAPRREGSDDRRKSFGSHRNDDERRKAFGQRKESDDDRRKSSGPRRNDDERRRTSGPRKEGDDSRRPAGARTEGGRRPLDLSRMGRTPSLGADKEVPLSRPAWRVRRKDRDADGNTDNK